MRVNDAVLPILLDAPFALLEGARWLCARRGSFIGAGRLRRVIRGRFAHLSAGTPRGRFPRVSKLAADGRNWYLRIYWMRYLHTAAQYLWAGHAARRIGVVAPAVRQTCLVRVAGRLCLAVIEDELPGERIGTWTPQLAAELGRGVAAWHHIERAPAFMRLAGSVRWPGRSYTATLHRPPRPGLSLSADERSAIRATCLQLRESGFVGDVVVSHGDLHARNLLALSRGGIGWLDLDRVRLRPAWHDLTAAVFDLLRHSPETIKAFEDAYFGVHPEREGPWRRHRLSWFVLYSLLKGVRFLSGRPVLPGQRDRSIEDRRARAAAHLVRAKVAATVRDGDADSGTLVREILDRVKENSRKERRGTRPSSQDTPSCPTRQTAD